MQLKGKWLFNEVLTKLPTTEVKVSYSFPEIGLTGCYRLLNTTTNYNGEVLKYWKNNDGAPFALTGILYKISTAEWFIDSRVIDFGKTEQTVPDYFYSWLVENAVKVPEIADKLLKIAENEPKVYEAGNIAEIKGIVQEINPAQIDADCLLQKELQTVADNTLRVYAAGQKAAKALKTTVSGSVIRVDNVNPIEHNLKVELCSKNIIGDFNITDNGGYPEINTTTNNRTVTFTFTANPMTSYFETTPIEVGEYGGKTITITNYCSFESSEVNPVLCVDIMGDSDKSAHLQPFESVTFNVEQGEVLYLWLRVEFSNYEKFDLTPISFSPMFELGDVSSGDYAPPIRDLSDVEVRRDGKNLLNFSILNSAYSDCKYENGVLQLPALAGNALACDTPYFYLPTKVKLCYRHTVSGGDRVIIRCFDKDGNNISQTTNIGWGAYLAYYEGYYGTGANGAVFTLPIEVAYIQLGYVGMNNANNENNHYTDFQIEVSPTPTDYEPYIAPQTVAANEDGTVEGLTSVAPHMTLMTNADGVLMNLTYNTDTK